MDFQKEVMTFDHQNVCHPLLKGEEVEVDVDLAALFMERQGTMAEDVVKLEAAAQQFLELYPEDRLDDDKTVVVLWNNDCMPARREEAYYKQPDWKALQAKRVKELFDEADDITRKETEATPEAVEASMQAAEKLQTEKMRKKKEKKKRRNKKQQKRK